MHAGCQRKQIRHMAGAFGEVVGRQLNAGVTGLAQRSAAWIKIFCCSSTHPPFFTGGSDLSIVMVLSGTMLL